MISLRFSFRAWGETFSPSDAAKDSHIQFDSFTEPGSIGTTGRYRGTPVPYGAAELINEPPSGRFIDDDWLELVRNLTPHCARAGATELSLHVDVEYEAQCNFEMSARELAALSSLALPFSVSCFSKMLQVGEALE